MPQIVIYRTCSFLKIDEIRGIARHPAACAFASPCVPPRASPPAAARGPAEGYFTRANSSAAVPGAHPPQSGAPGFALSHLSAASPGHAFAPLSATGLGFGQAGKSPGICINLSQCAGMQSRGRVYPRGSTRLGRFLFSGTCLSNTCLMFVFLTLTILRSLYLSEYECLTGF